MESIHSGIYKELPTQQSGKLKLKTSTEAKEIVSKAPLTNDGFDIAWTAFCYRFELQNLDVSNWDYI